MTRFTTNRLIAWVKKFERGAQFALASSLHNEIITSYPHNFSVISEQNVLTSIHFLCYMQTKLVYEAKLYHISNAGITMQKIILPRIWINFSLLDFHAVSHWIVLSRVFLADFFVCLGFLYHSLASCLQNEV